MSCPHENFEVFAHVARITAQEGDYDPIAFSMDLRIRCQDCHLPFEFQGFEAGFNLKKPLVSIDHQELRAPIVPQGSLLTENPLTGLVGFQIKKT